MPETARTAEVAPAGEDDALPSLSPDMISRTPRDTGMSDPPDGLLCKKGSAATTRWRSYDHKDAFEPAQGATAPPPDADELGSWLKYDGTISAEAAKAVSDDERPTSWSKYEAKPVASLLGSREKTRSKARVELRETAAPLDTAPADPTALPEQDLPAEHFPEVDPEPKDVAPSPTLVAEIATAATIPEPMAALPQSDRETWASTVGPSEIAAPVVPEEPALAEVSTETVTPPPRDAAAVEDVIAPTPAPEPESAFASLGADIHHDAPRAIEISDLPEPADMPEAEPSSMLREPTLALDVAAEHGALPAIAAPSETPSSEPVLEPEARELPAEAIEPAPATPMPARKAMLARLAEMLEQALAAKRASASAASEDASTLSAATEAPIGTEAIVEPPSRDIVDARAAVTYSEETPAPEPATETSEASSELPSLAPEEAAARTETSLEAETFPSEIIEAPAEEPRHELAAASEEAPGMAQPEPAQPAQLPNSEPEPALPVVTNRAPEPPRKPVLARLAGMLERALTRAPIEPGATSQERPEAATPAIDLDSPGAIEASALVEPMVEPPQREFMPAVDAEIVEPSLPLEDAPELDASVAPPVLAMGLAEIGSEPETEQASIETNEIDARIDLWQEEVTAASASADVAPPIDSPAELPSTGPDAVEERIVAPEPNIATLAAAFAIEPDFSAISTDGDGGIPPTTADVLIEESTTGAASGNIEDAVAAPQSSVETQVEVSADEPDFGATSTDPAPDAVPADATRSIEDDRISAAPTTLDRPPVFPLENAESAPTPAVVAPIEPVAAAADLPSEDHEVGIAAEELETDASEHNPVVPNTLSKEEDVAGEPVAAPASTVETAAEEAHMLAPPADATGPIEDGTRAASTTLDPPSVSPLENAESTPTPAVVAPIEPVAAAADLPTEDLVVGTTAEKPETVASEHNPVVPDALSKEEDAADEPVAAPASTVETATLEAHTLAPPADTTGPIEDGTTAASTTLDPLSVSPLESPESGTTPAVVAPFEPVAAAADLPSEDHSVGTAAEELETVALEHNPVVPEALSEEEDVADEPVAAPAPPVETAAELEAHPPAPMAAEPILTPVQQAKAAREALSRDLADVIHNVLSTTQFATKALKPKRYAEVEPVDAPELTEFAEELSASLPHPVVIKSRLGRMERLLGFASVGMLVAVGYFGLTLWRGDGSTPAQAPRAAGSAVASEDWGERARDMTRDLGSIAVVTEAPKTQPGNAEPGSSGTSPHAPQAAR